jgi:hypothetical protein
MKREKIDDYVADVIENCPSENEHKITIEKLWVYDISGAAHETTNVSVHTVKWLTTQGWIIGIEKWSSNYPTTCWLRHKSDT